MSSSERSVLCARKKNRSAGRWMMDSKDHYIKKLKERERAVIIKEINEMDDKDHYIRDLREGEKAAIITIPIAFILGLLMGMGVL
jgi:hypothetical protein